MNKIYKCIYTDREGERERKTEREKESGRVRQSSSKELLKIPN